MSAVDVRAALVEMLLELPEDQQRRVDLVALCNLPGDERHLSDIADYIEHAIMDVVPAEQLGNFTFAWEESARWLLRRHRGEWDGIGVPPTMTLRQLMRPIEEAVKIWVDRWDDHPSRPPVAPHGEIAF